MLTFYSEFAKTGWFKLVCQLRGDKWNCNVSLTNDFLHVWDSFFHAVWDGAGQVAEERSVVKERHPVGGNLHRGYDVPVLQG